MGAEPPHLFPPIPEWAEPLPAPGSCAVPAPPTSVTWSAQQDSLTRPLSLTHFRAARNLHSCTLDPSCPSTRRLICPGARVSSSSRPPAPFLGATF